MRLVVDGEIYHRQRVGGISRIYNEVLPRICDLDPNFDITLLTDGQLRQPVPIHLGIKHRDMPAYKNVLRPGRLWGKTVCRIKQATRNWWTKPDQASIWQATLYTPPPKWPGRFVVMFHDLMEERYPQWFTTPSHDRLRETKRICARTADAIICNSEVTRQDVCSFYGISKSKTHVVRLAAAPHFRRLPENVLEESQRSAPRVILFIGNRSRYKNFAFLLRSFGSWSERNDMLLVIVGAPLTASEQAQVTELALDDCVNVLSWIDDSDMCMLYNTAAAFVYPSVHEGFGIPLLEALACGCPIVASRIASTLEVAGDLPFYFAPEEENEFHVSLSAAIRHGRTEDRVLAGIRHAQSFSWDATARQFLTIYRELADWRGSV